MILAICRPAAGVDADAFAALVPQETAALRTLAEADALAGAWTTEGPGAVLLMDTDATTAEQLLADLPLAQAGLMTFDLQTVHPLPL